MTIKRWFKRLISGRPHFVIGGADAPYLLRWFLIPRNRWVNVYLHKFLRDDDDRALHDHPWHFVSIMLRGGYVETRPFSDVLPGHHLQTESVRLAPSIAFRRATDRHRVALLRDSRGRAVPCWTLVITGPKVRRWGFWCPKGFVPWEEFCDSTDRGNVGKGCG